MKNKKQMFKKLSIAVLCLAVFFTYTTSSWAQLATDANSSGQETEIYKDKGEQQETSSSEVSDTDTVREKKASQKEVVPSPGADYLSLELSDNSTLTDADDFEIGSKASKKITALFNYKTVSDKVTLTIPYGFELASGVASSTAIVKTTGSYKDPGGTVVTLDPNGALLDFQSEIVMVQHADLLYNQWKPGVEYDFKAESEGGNVSGFTLKPTGNVAEMDTVTGNVTDLLLTSYEILGNRSASLLNSFDISYNISKTQGIMPNGSWTFKIPDLPGNLTAEDAGVCAVDGNGNKTDVTSLFTVEGGTTITVSNNIKNVINDYEQAGTGKDTLFERLIHAESLTVEANLKLKSANNKQGLFSGSPYIEASQPVMTYNMAGEALVTVKAAEDQKVTFEVKQGTDNSLSPEVETPKKMQMGTGADFYAGFSAVNGAAQMVHTGLKLTYEFPYEYSPVKFSNMGEASLDYTYNIVISDKNGVVNTIKVPAGSASYTPVLAAGQWVSKMEITCPESMTETTIKDVNWPVTFKGTFSAKAEDVDGTPLDNEHPAHVKFSALSDQKTLVQETADVLLVTTQDNAKIEAVDQSSKETEIGYYGSDKSIKQGTGISFKLWKDAETKEYDKPQIELTGDAVKLITKINSVKGSKDELVPSAYKLSSGDWVEITDPDKYFDESTSRYDFSSILGSGEYFTGLKLNPVVWNSTVVTKETDQQFSIYYYDLMPGCAGFDAATGGAANLPKAYDFDVKLYDRGNLTAYGDQYKTAAKPLSATLIPTATDVQAMAGSELKYISGGTTDYEDLYDFRVNTQPSGKLYKSTELAAFIPGDSSTTFANPVYGGTVTVPKQATPSTWNAGSRDTFFMGYMQSMIVEFKGDTAEERAALALTKGISLAAGGARTVASLYLHWDYKAKVYYTTNKQTSYQLANDSGTVKLNGSSDRAMLYFPLASDEYVTGIKVVMPDNFYSWGGNELKGTNLVNGISAHSPTQIPDIGLAIKGKVPEQTPVTGDRDELGVFQDGQRLGFAGTFSYTDALGVAHDSTFEGLTSRLSCEQLVIGEFTADPVYKSDAGGNNSVYQGQKTTASVTHTYSFNENGRQTDEDYPDADLRPVLYYKIDKDYSVGDFAELEKALKAKIKFKGDHFSDGDGLLIIEYTAGSEAVKPETSFTIDIPLVAKPTAKPSDSTVPVKKCWIDTIYDKQAEVIADKGYTVIASSEVAQTYKDSDKTLQSDENEVLLTTDLDTTNQILKLSEAGVTNYATADGTRYISSVENTDRDQNNIFGMQVVLNTPNGGTTRDWYFYTAVPKKGESIQYYQDNQLKTATSEFSMYPCAQFKVYKGSGSETEVTEAKVLYTTDKNPVFSGLSGNAPGTEWKTYSEITDKTAITYVCVYLPELDPTEKISYEVPMRLTERKNVIGELTAYSTTRYNYKNTGGELQLSDSINKTNVTGRLSYTLVDMVISGQGWKDDNSNGLRDTGEGALTSGKISAADDGVTVKDSEGSDYSVALGSGGKYTIYIPHTSDKWHLTYSGADSGILTYYHAAGGNSKIWSDFVPSGTDKTGMTEAITVDGESDVTGVDVGVKGYFRVTYDWGSDVPTGVTLPTDSKEYKWHDDVSSLPDGTYKNGDTVDAAKTGQDGTWTFSGWTTDADLKDGVTTDIKYTGSWSFKEAYHVTFDTDGGTPVPKTQRVLKDEKAVEPTTSPEKPGYTFIEWQYEDPGEPGVWKDYDFNTAVTKDITLKAKWDENIITIKYKSENTAKGTVSRASTGLGAATGTPQGSSATPAAGYDFDGWYLGTSKVSSNVTFIPAVNSDGVYEEATYVAKFTPRTNTPYTIEYYKKNDTGSGYDLVTEDTVNGHGTTDTYLTDAAVAPKAYNGYSFELRTYENKTETAQTAPLKISGDGSLIVKIYYTQKTYPVTFVETVTGGTAQGSSTDLEQHIIYGKKAAAGVTAVAENLEYVFTGWSWKCTDDKGNETTGTIDDYTDLEIKGATQFTPVFAHTPFVQINSGGNGYVKVSGSSTGTPSQPVVGNLTTDKYEWEEDPAPTAYNAVIKFKGKEHYAVTGLTVIMPNGSNTPINIDLKTGAVNAPGLADSVSLQMASDNRSGTITISGLKTSALFNVSFSPVTYDVTFDTDGGSTAPAKQTIMEAGKVNRPADLTREHYIFAGWQYEDPDSPGTWKDYDFDTPVTGDFTLKAKWTEEQVTINYVSENSSMGTVSRPTDTIKAITGKPEGSKANAAAGYTLDGWYLGGIKISTAETLIPAKETDGAYKAATYMAKFKANIDTPYKVEYYQKNTAGTGYDKVTADTVNGKGTTDTYLPSSVTAPKKYQGFTYKNTTYEDGKNTAQSGALKIAGDGSLTVKLYYTRNAYPVTFVISVTGGTASGTVQALSQAVGYGEKAAAGVTTTSWNGEYVFTGWSWKCTDDEGKVTTGTVDDYKDLDIKGATEFTPMFSHTPFVQINSDGGGYVKVSGSNTGVPATPVVGKLVTDKYEWPEFPEPTVYNAIIKFKAKEHYTADKLTLTLPNSGNKTEDIELKDGVFSMTDFVDAGALTMDPDGKGGTITLTGVKTDGLFKITFKEIKYDVVFDADGGSPVPATQKVTEGSKASEPADPSKANHTFVGWQYEDPATPGSWKNYNFNTPVTGDLTLKAKWTEKEIVIKYESENTAKGTVSRDSTKVAVMTGTPESSKAIPAIGYEFAGWYLGSTKVSSDAEYTPVPDSSGIYKEATYVARFNAKIYPVTFERDVKGGTSSGTSGALDQKQSYGAKAAAGVTGVPENSDYTFKTWMWKMTDDNGKVTSGTTNDYRTVLIKGATVFTPVYAFTPYVKIKSDGNGYVKVNGSGTGTPASPSVGKAISDEYKWKADPAPKVYNAVLKFKAKDGYKASKLTVKMPNGSNKTFSLTLKDGEAKVSKIAAKAENNIVSQGLSDKATLNVSTDLKSGTITVSGLKTSAEFKVSFEKIKYTVIIDTGGSDKEKETVAAGGKIDKPSDPVRDGYTFNGWYYEDPNHPGVWKKYDFNSPVTGNVDLKAKWTKDENSNGTDESGRKKAGKTGGSGGTITASGRHPQTGDDSNVMVWIILLMAGGAGILVASRRRKEK